MVCRRKRLGKFAEVSFAEPPWNEGHPKWIDLEQDLDADHLARRIVNEMPHLDLTPLFDSYSGGGTPPIRPDLMLRIVLIEIQLGRCKPCEWCRDARENTPLMWAGFGIRPSQSVWYEFADRVAPFLDEWNRTLLDVAKRAGVTTATEASLDGSTVAANASRHILLNEGQVAKRREALGAVCGLSDAAPPDPPPAWMATTPHGRLGQLDRLERAAHRLEGFHEVNERQRRQRRRPRAKIVVSPSDPEAALGLDKLDVFRPLYNVQLVRDLESQLVLGYDVFPQTKDDGTLKPILDRLQRTFDVHLHTLLADSGYVTACNIAMCERLGITLYGPWQENDFSDAKKKPTKFTKDQFTWLPDENAYECPAGHRLTPIGKERTPQIDGAVHTVYRYRCNPEHCRACPLQEQCTTDKHGRSLRRSEHQDDVDDLQSRMASDAGKALYKRRRETAEQGFADMKEHRNLRRFSGRGLYRAKRQTALTVLAHNLTVLSRTAPRHPAESAAEILA